MLTVVKKSVTVDVDRQRAFEVFDPPSRLVLAWHITEEWGYDPDPEHSSEVEVQFIAESPTRTRVELEHRGFERHGTGGTQIREVVDGPGGWDALLPRYAEAVSTR